MTALTHAFCQSLHQEGRALSANIGFRIVGTGCACATVACAAEAIHAFQKSLPWQATAAIGAAYLTGEVAYSAFCFATDLSTPSCRATDAAKEMGIEDMVIDLRPTGLPPVTRHVLEIAERLRPRREGY